MENSEFATNNATSDAIHQEWQVSLAALARIEARLAEAERVLPNPDKLDLLADWFDQDDANKGKTSFPEVQRDLRAWAKGIRTYLASREQEDRDG